MLRICMLYVIYQTQIWQTKSVMQLHKLFKEFSGNSSNKNLTINISHIRKINCN